jgi:hypothetical protein
MGFIFLNPTKLVWFFLIFLRISRDFTRHRTELQEKLDRDLHKQALHFYAKHLSKILITAIRSLAGEGRRGSGQSGEPAAISAGQGARLDHKLT